MTTLRIAQLANFVGPVSGGMKVAIDALGKGYVAAGHERILVIPGPKDRISESESGITVEIAAPRISASYRMIATPWRALDILDRFRPTSIESSDKWTLTPAAGWAARRGIGSVLFSHERLDDMLAMWIRRQFGVAAVVGALDRRLSKSFDVVVVTSDYSAGEFADTGAHLVKVPLGVDLETFNPDKREPGMSTPHPDGVLRLCYVGRMSHEKSPQMAVAAAAELHRRGIPLRLDMYGVGPDEDAMKEQAGDAPVFFNGFVAGRDEVARRFAAADIAMSVCPAETFGLASLEALACGTPVVTANSGGAHEIVDTSSGEAGTPDADGLADATQRLMARLGPDLRVAARRRAEQFTWDASVDKMLAIHSEIAARPGTKPYWKQKLKDRHDARSGVDDPLAPHTDTQHTDTRQNDEPQERR
ncbi:glycosyltransferase [Cutibacterium equinum]|uniref:Glycosyltransferase n=1 Tax=Cutibacterium equinum TaxID=3016342 RepID=A0ABY7QWS2_9ACTN|nr:glycosyltransferase [Cutibacterium equinum]WCC79498.1 glycosyltransferase [Cutibacterium equinum]